MSNRPLYRPIALLLSFAFLLCIPGEGAADEPALTKQFDKVFGQNLQSAKVHFLGAIDCENRDEFTGMPTSTLTLPGAARSYVDTTENSATHLFPRKGAKQADLQAFVRARVKANVPKDYAYQTSKGSTDAQMVHKTTPDAFPTVELSQSGEHLSMIFRAPDRAETPWGNRCNKPKAKAKAKAKAAK